MSLVILDVLFHTFKDWGADDVFHAAGIKRGTAFV